MDKDGDLLPINNDNNFNHVLNYTIGILRLLIQRKGECYDYYHQQSTNMLSTTSSSSKYLNIKPTSNTIIKNLKELTSSNHHSTHHNQLNKPIISYPEDFRPVSAIIDVDILPETYRRVRLHKHKSSKPLGFYIRDGRSIRVTANGVEQVPSIFISRLMPGGLAESTGLLSVNDEVIEVNGIEVAGKTLDQVTDMMIANSSNLIITVKPANQRYNLDRSHVSAGGTGTGSGPMNMSMLNKTTPQQQQTPSNISNASSSSVLIHNHHQKIQQQQQQASSSGTTHKHTSNASSISSNSASSKRSNSNTNLNRTNSMNQSNNNNNNKPSTQKSQAPQPPTNTITSSNSNNNDTTLLNHNHIELHTTNNYNNRTSDEEDDDEVHDANSNDDKILTL